MLLLNSFHSKSLVPTRDYTNLVFHIAFTHSALKSYSKWLQGTLLPSLYSVLQSRLSGWSVSQSLETCWPFKYPVVSFDFFVIYQQRWPCINDVRSISWQRGMWRFVPHWSLQRVWRCCQWKVLRRSGLPALQGECWIGLNCDLSPITTKIQTFHTLSPNHWASMPTWYLEQTK